MISRTILEEIEKNEVLTSEENTRLAIAAKNGDLAAREKLLRHNYRLIHKLVKKYCIDPSREDDMFNEGVCRFLRSLNTFDPAKSSFITHAYYWIRSAMLDYYKENNDFHYDPSFYYKKVRYDRIVSENGGQPVSDETLKQNDLTQADVDSILKYQKASCISLDELYNDNPGGTDTDRVFDTDEIAEKRVYDMELKEVVRKEISRILTPREQEVVMRYFGIGGKRERLSDIAQDLGITRQAANKFNQKAICKLKGSLELCKFGT